jgi:hypothetical protein
MVDKSMTPQRIQLKRTKGWRKPENTVVVSRPSPFGNYAGSTRQAFEEDLAAMSNADRAFFMDKVETLRGKNLACWCKIGAPCHADVLLELANAPYRQASSLQSPNNEVKL